MLNEALILAEVVILSATLPLSVVAALGFWGSPFSKVTGPLPVVIACYLVADGSRLIFGHPPPYAYALLSSVAVVAAVYAAVNGAMLLTERRSV